MDKISEEHFDKTFNVNVKGVLFTVQRALPLFKDGGCIILNGSIAASKALEGNTVYSATKAAVRSFARTWTLELRSRRIRVNVISPGPIDTPGLNNFIRGMGMDEDQFKKGILSSVPSGRMGTPDEVASTVLFLATDESSYVTGIELFVDGGMAQV